jgi:hypothetical protein
MDLRRTQQKQERSDYQPENARSNVDQYWDLYGSVDSREVGPERRRLDARF